MNSSINITRNTTVIGPESVDDVLWRVLTVIDVIARSYGVSIHLFYIFILIISKKLQTRTMLYVNHAIITNSFYVTIMFMYLFSDRPRTDNQIFNEFVCTVSEIIWGSSLYLRIYSILLIAIYRYLAVFKIYSYKKMNDSLTYLIGPIIIVWLFSVGCPIILKNSLGTTPNPVFCLDGNSTIFLNTVLYFCIMYTLMLLLPTIAIFVLYSMIMIRLRQMGRKLRHAGSNSFSHSDARTHNKTQTNTQAQFSTDENYSNINNKNNNMKNSTKLNKEKKFANQFILMCISVIVSDLVVSIFSVRGIIPNYFAIFFYWRPILRSTLQIAFSLIPIISIYYNFSKINLYVKRVLSCNFKQND
jgi:hypothetical protein